MASPVKLGGKPNDRQELRLRVPAEIKARLWVLGQRMGHTSLVGYVRALVVRGMAEDLKQVPTMFLRARPGARVFRVDREVFTPLAECQGGERVWVLHNYGYGPKALGGKIFFLADITAGEIDGGLEGRDVLIAAEDTA